MEAKFTKGNWKRHANKIVVGKTTIAVASSCDPKSVYAREKAYPSDSDEIISNANLIAAAPDMFNALTAFIEITDKARKIDEYVIGMKTSKALFNKIRKAIKKATE